MINTVLASINQLNQFLTRKMKYTILALNFTKDGGIAHFTDSIAIALQKKGKLNQLIATTKIPNRVFEYKTEQSVCTGLMETINSIDSRIIRLLSYFILFLKATFELMKSPKCMFFVNSCFGFIQLLYVLPLKCFRRKYSILLHGLDIIKNSNKHPGLSKWVYKGANTIYVNSNATRELLNEKYNIRTEKIKIIHPIIQADKLLEEPLLDIEQLSQTLDIELNDKVIISSICRLDKRKGLDILINSMIKNHQSNKNWLVLIGGIGPEEETLKQLIKENKAEHYIRLLGYIDDKTKYSILNYSSLFVMPTRSFGNNEFEGFGISFIEASYFKTPVIGGIHGGVSEAISNNQTGFLIDFDQNNSIDKLSDKINQLLKDKVLLNQLGENGRIWVEENYTRIDTNKFC